MSGIDLKAYARSFHSDRKRVVDDRREFAAERVKVNKKKADDEAQEKRRGYVYYAGDGNGRIKIGFSQNPWSRVKEMRCANPSIDILICEKTDDGITTERLRHEEFREYHLALEWFSMGERLLEHVNRLRIGAGKGVSVSNYLHAKQLEVMRIIE